MHNKRLNRSKTVNTDMAAKYEIERTVNCACGSKHILTVTVHKMDTTIAHFYPEHEVITIKLAYYT
jgi:hypothetical protein